MLVIRRLGSFSDLLVAIILSIRRFVLRPPLGDFEFMDFRRSTKFDVHPEMFLIYSNPILVRLGCVRIP